MNSKKKSLGGGVSRECKCINVPCHVGAGCHAVSYWTLILSVWCLHNSPQSRTVHQEWFYIRVYRREPSEHTHCRVCVHWRRVHTTPVSFFKMDFTTGVVAQAFSPSTQEAGAGKSLSLRCKEGVPRQLGLHLSQEGKERFLQKSFKCTMNK